MSTEREPQDVPGRMGAPAEEQSGYHGSNRFLLDLADAIRPLVDPQEIQAEAARRLGRHLRANRAFYAEVDEGGNAVFAFDYCTAGMQPIAVRYRHDDFGAVFAGTLREGRVLAVADIEAIDTLAEAERQRCRDFGIRALLKVPLVKQGRLVAFLALHQSEPRTWSDEEVALTLDVASRTWDVVDRAKAEAALRASEEKYRSLFESIDAGFCVMELVRGEDGRISDLVFREVNDAFVRQTGLDGVIGKPVGGLLPDFRQPWIDICSCVAATGESRYSENYVPDTHRWYAAHQSRIGGEGSRFVAVIFNDITERKRIALADRRLSAIVESTDDAIISKDLDGIIETWNTGAERIFGYAEYEVVGKSIMILMPPDRVAEEPEILARLRKGERVDHYETVRQRKDGSLINVSLTISPIFGSDGKVVAASKIARDISQRKRVEADLHELQTRLQLTMAAANVGTWEWDVARDRLKANERLAELFHVDDPKTAATVGLPLESFISAIHPDDRPRVKRLIHEAIETGGDYRLEHRIVNVDGSIRWVEARGKVEGNSPDGAHFFGVLIDITQRKRGDLALRESDQRHGFLLMLSDALREQPDGDTVGAVCARMLAKHLGVARCYMAQLSQLDGLARMVAEFRRGGLLPAYGEDGELSLAAFPACMRQLESAPLVINDARVAPGFSDTERKALLALAGHVALIAAPLRVGGRNATWALVVGSDVPRAWTPQEVQLVEDVAERAWSVIDRATKDAALREREAEVRRVSRVKDEFIAMLGHELRNPLAPIATTLQLMKLRAPDVLARERGVIEAQVQQLTGLVNDLLDVTRIASGKVELDAERVDVDDVIAAAVESTQDAMESNRQTLHVRAEEGLAVSGDRRRLVQVLTNLLGNAAKYSPPDRNIWLSAEAEDGQVVLRVRDEGRGIPHDLLPRVFESFTQDSRGIDRSQGGLGLGLSIVRSLVLLHGGGVGVESDGPYKGSEFIVRLPLLDRPRPGVEMAKAAMAPARDAPGMPPQERIKVLIVDDYAPAAESLALLLHEMGYRTQVAPDGAAGLAALATFRPQIALVDIGLPVIDGYEVAQTVRRTPGFEKLPLVAITGYGQASDHARVLGAGFHEHLVKPLDAGRISELIERLVTAA